MTPMNWGVFGRRRELGSPQSPPLQNLTVSRESFEVTVSGGSTFARVKLKEIDGMAPQDVERAV